MSTPNMDLTLPSPLVTLGPTWAQLLNDALEKIDAHDHSSGNGVPIGTAALNIDGDLDFSGYALDNLSRSSLVNLDAADATPRSIYSFGGELYYTDASGNNVQLTIGGSPAGGGGTIDGLISPASAYYNSGAQTFEWSATAVLRASLDFGRAIFRTGSASSGAAIILQAPTSGVTAYTLTFPTAAPAAGTTRVLGAGTTGALSWIGPDGTTLEISGTTLQVKALGITTAKLADAPNGVTTGKINDLQVTTAKLANAPNGITNGKINLGAVTGGISGTTPTGSIAYQTIATENIANSAITSAKIGNLEVKTANINSLSITTDKIADAPNGVTGDKITVGSVNGDRIANAPNGIANGKINLGAVTGGISGTSPTGSIAYRTVATENIAQNAITTAKLALQPNGVANGNINVGAVTGGISGTSPTGSIAYRTIATENLAEGIVTGSKLATDSVSTSKIVNGDVTRAKIDTRAVGLTNRGYDFRETRTGTGNASVGAGTVTIIDNVASRLVFTSENLGIVHFGIGPAWDGSITEFYGIGEDGHQTYFHVIVELCSVPIGGGTITVRRTAYYRGYSSDTEAENRFIPLQFFSRYHNVDVAGEYYLRVKLLCTSTGASINNNTIRYEYLNAWLAYG